MRNLFNMSSSELTRHHVVLRCKEKGLNQAKAAELLGISPRHFRRLLKAYKEEGASGLTSKKPQLKNRSLKKETKDQIISLLKTKYTDCGPTFARDKLALEEKIKVSKETLRKIMIEEGLWEARKKKTFKVHQRRDRREFAGELVQLDGSPHAWFEKRGSKCCLLGFIDDATNQVYLEFASSESTESYFKSLKNYMIEKGKPLAFYTDRLSAFRVNNDKEGYRKQGLTQIGRALKELGIELICANSPQAKGRVERLFKTLQDRLVKEMRLLGINTIEAANQYLPIYIKEHNELFSITAAQPVSKFRPTTQEELNEALQYKESRKLSKNLELSYNGRIFQIQVNRSGYLLVGAQVIVEEDLEGKITIKYQKEPLSYKELLVRDRQGIIKSKKEVLLTNLG